MPPRGEAGDEAPPSLAPPLSPPSRDSPPNSSMTSSSSPMTPLTSSSGGTPISQGWMSPETNALYRLLSGYHPEVSERDSPDNLVERLPGYQRIVFPREQTLLDILRQSCGTQDVRRARVVRLRVVAAAVSLSRMSAHVPRVRELRLDGSGLASLREIGTGLRYLKVLHVARCGLVSLDGTFGLTTLQELHAADNQIDNVAPCAALENIKVLTLDRNPISCLRAVSLLSLCPKLRSLSLVGTPLSRQDGYREAILGLLPGLKKLDGEAIHEFDGQESFYDDSMAAEIDKKSDTESASCSFELSSMTEPNSEDCEESMPVPMIASKSNTPNLLDIDMSSTSYNDCFKSTLPKRPSTAIGISTEQSTFSGAPLCHRPKTAVSKTMIAQIEDGPIFPELMFEASPSRLTSGPVVCGNIGRALARARSTTHRSREISGEDTRTPSIEDQTNDMCVDQQGPTPNLDNAKRILENPLPEKPAESTPLVDLEFGVTGSIDAGTSWDPGDDVMMQKASKDALKASRKWRKAFKTYRKQNDLTLPSEDEKCTIQDEHNDELHYDGDIQILRDVSGQMSNLSTFLENECLKTGDRCLTETRESFRADDALLEEPLSVTGIAKSLAGSAEAREAELHEGESECLPLGEMEANNET